MRFWRRSNRRRRDEPRRRLPSLPWLRLAGIAGAVLLLAGTGAGVRWLLDRPVGRVVLNGQFERVSADRLEAVLRPYMGRGFLETRLEVVQAEIAGIPWVASARVRRRWPDTIEVTLREEEPAARWGDQGLLNPQGRLFVRQATHIPAELPRLRGPEGTEAEVAARFLAIREQLIQRGLNLVALELDGRGAWSFQLSNGIRVQLGSRDVDARLLRFYRALDRIVAAQADEIGHVDMRYPNGFAIGWKQNRPANAGVAPGEEDTVPNA